MLGIARLNNMSLFGGTAMYEKLLFCMKQYVSGTDKMRMQTVNH